MNAHGDGQDVWPWVSPTNRTRFDCGKGDPRNLGFNHLDRRKLRLHRVHHEPEKDQLPDDGDLGPTLKLPLPPRAFTTDWFDIRRDGDRIPAEPIGGPGQVALDRPPRDAQKDGVVLGPRRK